LVVADLWQNKGLCCYLMDCLIDTAQTKQLRKMEGTIPSNNKNFLTLLKNLGFSIQPSKKDASLQLATKSFL
jgi:acetyltransferase